MGDILPTNQRSQQGVQNTPTSYLQRGKTPPNLCLEYDNKLSDGEAPVFDCLVWFGLLGFMPYQPL